MKKVIVLLMVFMLGFGLVNGFAKEDEGAAVTKEAFNDVKVATQLFTEANDLVTNGDLNRQKGETAMTLYARAGQLFERAEGVFKAVGFTYVSQQDIDGAKAAKESCMSAMEAVKKRLTGLPI